MPTSAKPPEPGETRTQALHNIGEAASLSGVPARMIRHYESIGLMPVAARTHAGYRLYGDADVHRLRFIRRARGLGFSMKQIEVLLALWSDRSRASAEVKRLAQRHAADLGERIAEMQAISGHWRTSQVDATGTSDRSARSWKTSAANRFPATSADPRLWTGHDGTSVAWPGDRQANNARTQAHRWIRGNNRPAPHPSACPSRRLSV